MHIPVDVHSTLYCTYLQAPSTLPCLDHGCAPNAQLLLIIWCHPRPSRRQLGFASRHPVAHAQQGPIYMQEEAIAKTIAAAAVGELELMTGIIVKRYHCDRCLLVPMLKSIATTQPVRYTSLIIKCTRKAISLFNRFCVWIPVVRSWRCCAQTLRHADGRCGPHLRKTGVLCESAICSRPLYCRRQSAPYVLDAAGPSFAALGPEPMQIARLKSTQNSGTLDFMAEVNITEITASQAKSTALLASATSFHTPSHTSPAESCQG